MSDAASEPPTEPGGVPRPLPPRGIRELLADWFTWVGPVRLVSTVVAVVVVVTGGWWLVRSPAPPTEAGLRAVTATTNADGAPSATLPPPSTAAPPTTSPATSAPPTNVVVHVAGEVVAPGVYVVAGDGRVHLAIEAAGGATADAELDGLNLAAPLVDGQRVYVPTVGEVDPAGVPDRPDAIAPEPVSTGPVGPIDLNRATAVELESLPGVGPATATAIVDDRARNGPFATVDDLDRVSGIGPSKLAAIRDLVTV